MISFNVRVNLNTRGLQQATGQALQVAQMQLDNDVLKDANYFIPKDTGELERSGIRASQIGEGRIIWDAKYARKLYYNPDYNFSKDVNPNAQGLWFEAAKAQKKQNWLEEAKRKYREFFSRR